MVGVVEQEQNSSNRFLSRVKRWRLHTAMTRPLRARRARTQHGRDLDWMVRNRRSR